MNEHSAFPILAALAILAVFPLDVSDAKTAPDRDSLVQVASVQPQTMLSLSAIGSTGT
jgi:hypothetical protein